MPILILYITYIITMPPLLIWVSLAGPDCSLHRRQQMLHHKATKFQLTTMQSLPQDYIPAPYFAPSRDSIFFGLPFTVANTHPDFQPITGYPKCLCVFGNVELDQQYSQAPSRLWYIDLLGFPVLDLLYTGSSATFLMIMSERCYLVAFVSDSNGSQLVPFSANARPICIDSGSSVTVSNNKDGFISLKPIGDYISAALLQAFPLQVSVLLSGLFSLTQA
jgi:hypothetical protein